jgi:hypothetical protein
MVALLTLTVAAVVATATAASAHAVLVSSDPASGATVAAPPSTVRLTFDENVRAPAYVIVTGPGGIRIDEGAPKILDATVTQHLKPGEAAGAYTIAYRVVSADGHPVEDELTYSLTGAAGTTAQRSAAAAASSSAAAAPAAAAATVEGASNAEDGSHLLHVLGGFAVVLAGAGALVYERVERRRHSGDSAASR